MKGVLLRRFQVRVAGLEEIRGTVVDPGSELFNGRRFGTPGVAKREQFLPQGEQDAGQEIDLPFGNRFRVGFPVQDPFPGGLEGKRAAEVSGGEGKTGSDVGPHPVPGVVERIGRIDGRVEGIEEVEGVVVPGFAEAVEAGGQGTGEGDRRLVYQSFPYGCICPGLPVLTQSVDRQVPFEEGGFERVGADGFVPAVAGLPICVQTGIPATAAEVVFPVDPSGIAPATP